VRYQKPTNRPTLVWIFISLMIAIISLSCGLLEVKLESTGSNSTHRPVEGSPPANTPTITLDDRPINTTQAKKQLNPFGPWMVFVTGDGSHYAEIWAANPDGTAITQLADDAFIGGYRGDYLFPRISPNGRFIAYVKVVGPPLQAFLHVIDLSTRENNRTVQLYDETYLAESQEIKDVILFQANSLAWTPDGQTLAFIGAMEGGTADIYLHEPAERSVSHLGVIPGEAYLPVWSQDGTTLLYTATSEFHQGEGYSPYMFTPQGLWTLDRTTYENMPVPWPYGSQPEFIKYFPWFGSTFIFFGQGSPCEDANGCWLDTQSGERGNFPFPVIEYAISPQDGSLLATSFNTTLPSDSAGTYLFTPDNPSGRRVADFELDNLQWLAQAGVFTGQDTTVPELQSVFISPAGEVLKTLHWDQHPDYMEYSASPNGAHSTWYRNIDLFETGLWIGDNASQSLQPVTDFPVNEAIWSPDSQSVFFTVDEFNPLPGADNQGLYRVDQEGQHMEYLFPIPAENFISLLGFAGNQ